ncbi:hypothetical protein GCM10027445_52910 [Amycolatopsis endophytica]|uniref:Uncharacterized protein n=1 Tax=Amycolatopsis endophytica TaxID=860233 RepID=A0A853BAJ7_9PSEU|nr:hypothetical protein [Amycolatopsis endophytica]NYI91772.1 hypothetical protein [Amycolatopsis endophytica]
MPDPLHAYLLYVTRSSTGSDKIATVHRVTLSCPGEFWCHRGGCTAYDAPDIDSLLLPLVAAGHAADADEIREDYLHLYGAANSAEPTDTVLDAVDTVLSHAGWIELDRSTWEGGLEEVLLRRAQHCLTVMYDPITRRLRLTDGKPELRLTLDMLAEDGVLTGEASAEQVDMSADAVERWGSDLLTAARDLLRGSIDELPRQDELVEGTVLGLHPHAHGDLHGPAAIALAQTQVSTLIHNMGLLGDEDRMTHA